MTMYGLLAALGFVAVMAVLNRLFRRKERSATSIRRCRAAPRVPACAASSTAAGRDGVATASASALRAGRTCADTAGSSCGRPEVGRHHDDGRDSATW